MIDIEKKIAEDTLKKLLKKSWEKLTLDDVLDKKVKKQKFINSKTDLIKNLNRYVDNLLIKKTKDLFLVGTINKWLVKKLIFLEIS